MGTVRANRAKRWTYLIVGVLLFLLFVILNYAVGNWEDAKKAIQGFLGLPGWLYPIIVAGVGLLIFWFGTKIEADWPEVVGAGMISLAVAVGEIMIGWTKFALGGMSIMPILIPIAVFLIFLVVGMLKTR